MLIFSITSHLIILGYQSKSVKILPESSAVFVSSLDYPSWTWLPRLPFIARNNNCFLPVFYKKSVRKKTAVLCTIRVLLQFSGWEVKADKNPPQIFESIWLAGHYIFFHCHSTYSFSCSIFISTTAKMVTKPNYMLQSYISIKMNFW